MIRWLNVKQPEPERYFKSDFLERFTFMKLSTVWMIWGPISLLSLFASFFAGGKAFAGSSVSFLVVTLVIIVTLFLGFLRWSIVEYFLHRFPFHYDGPNKLRRKISWYAHGIHHEQAMLSTRLVAPPLVSLLVGCLIGLVDWLVLGLIFQAGWIGFALFCGTALGYLFYDTMHWSVHFIDTDWPWYRKVRSNHMRHHRFPDTRFGVSNTLWDHVFQTYPKEKKAKEPQPEGTDEDSTAETTADNAW